MAKPTIEGAAEYYLSGSCPFCGAGPDCISWDEINVEGYAVTQEATCNECDGMFFDVYLRHSIQARRWEEGDFWEHTESDVLAAIKKEKEAAHG